MRSEAVQNERRPTNTFALNFLNDNSGNSNCTTTGGSSNMNNGGSPNPSMSTASITSTTTMTTTTATVTTTTTTSANNGSNNSHTSTFGSSVPNVRNSSPQSQQIPCKIEPNSEELEDEDRNNHSEFTTQKSDEGQLSSHSSPSGSSRSVPLTSSGATTVGLLSSSSSGLTSGVVGSKHLDDNHFTGISKNSALSDISSSSSSSSYSATVADVETNDPNNGSYLQHDIKPPVIQTSLGLKFTPGLCSSPQATSHSLQQPPAVCLSTSASSFARQRSLTSVSSSSVNNNSTAYASALPAYSNVLEGCHTTSHLDPDCGIANFSRCMNRNTLLSSQLFDIPDNKRGATQESYSRRTVRLLLLY